MLRIEETLNGTIEAEPTCATGALPRFRVARGAVPYLMVAPALTILGAFVIYPIFYMIWLSLFKWNMIGSMKFVGLGNFQALWGDQEFWQVMGNTFQYTAFTVLFSVTLGLLTALYFRKGSRIGRFLQSMLFMPYVVSLVSIAFVWMWLMDSDFGLLNFLLGLIHLPKVGWLDDPDVALKSLIVVSVWKSLGYNTIILLSAMQAVPGYLYEAASLDKGKPLSVFFRITLPMISPTLFFLTLMNMIASFKVFETVAVMTHGGPVNATNSLVYDIYMYGFSYYKIGYASAMGVVLMAIIGGCTALYFLGLSRRVHYR
jgi:sn-glycerol 3-phosphate transport system permease protein